MLPEKRLLIAVDGSTVSDWTLRRARRLLGSLGTTVTLLRVIECRDEQARSAYYRGDLRHRAAREGLALLRNGIQGRGADVKAELRFGDPATEILREIVEGRHDFVIMSTHAQVGIAHAFLGSVTERVLRSSPVPLILFRPLLGSGETLSPVEDFSPAPFANPMVALDGSLAAEGILPHVLEVARVLGSRLHFFRAVPPGPQEADQIRDSGAYLTSLRKILEERGVSSELCVRKGALVGQALAAIRELKLDSVAMTTRGHSGVALSIYGSAAWELTRDGGVPMLLLTQPALRLPLPAPAEGPRHVPVE